MDKSRYKMVFICQQCGKESPKWLGHCPSCQEWNTFVETQVSSSKGVGTLTQIGSPVRELSQITAEEMPRLVLPSAEFNRVLGGGIVPGSLVLISGDPGIGKSTLLLQVSAMIAQQGKKVVYASGEESLYQTRLRADRLGVKGEGLYLLAETDFEVILERMEETSPSLGVIDSIQTVYLRELEGAPGSISQIRECTLRLMQWAKLSAIPLLITGHVTKEGAIAGPKALEHIVDVVLYLEGESFSTYRLLRGVKNRFGSTNEVGIFEMREQGLVEVENPSQVFLSQRSKGAIGSVVAPTLEGTRSLLVEMQALTTTTSFGLPRRTANGIDFNRLLLIIAVLTKRAGLRLSNQDIIVNVVGGLKISEPAADLAVALSIASSFSDKEVDPNLVAVGEVGLSGEVRGVPQLERRLIEAARQGFTRCVGPRVSLSSLTPPQGMELTGVNSLREALRVGLKSKSNM
ncbi:MAG: DNA repair protein RadA [Dehalococcoidia bacterium]|nr:MAG: DNA repair protein RadA [Dehalococcoidia bacterium]